MVVEEAMSYQEAIDLRTTLEKAVEDGALRLQASAPVLAVALVLVLGVCWWWRCC